MSYDPPVGPKGGVMTMAEFGSTISIGHEAVESLDAESPS